MKIIRQSFIVKLLFSIQFIHYIYSDTVDAYITQQILEIKYIIINNY